MDAGRAYNDFPFMNGQWVPDEYWAIQGWRGFFENTAAVQLHHRLLATTTLVSVLTTWGMFRGRVLPHASRQLLNAMAAMTAVQVSMQAELEPTSDCASMHKLHLERCCQDVYRSLVVVLQSGAYLRCATTTGQSLFQCKFQWSAWC